MMRAMGSFAKRHTLPLIACIAAVISAFFVPPSAAYLDYFDFKTLACLFSVLAVVTALRNIRFFYKLFQFLIQLLVV